MSPQSNKAAPVSEAKPHHWDRQLTRLTCQRYKGGSESWVAWRVEFTMSDETTQNLFGAQLGELISLVKNLTNKHTATDARVERLERVLEERLYDTRPIWEAVQAQVQPQGERIARIESETTGMRLEMTGMRSEMTEMRSEMTEMRKQNTQMLMHMVTILTQMNEMRVETANGFRGVNRRIALLGKTLIDMTVDIHELQDKVEKIESQPL